MFRCRCGWSSFSVTFEYKEPLTIGPAVVLRCQNHLCMMMHRVETGTEWTREFPQISMQAEKVRRERAAGV